MATETLKDTIRQLVESMINDAVAETIADLKVDADVMAANRKPNVAAMRKVAADVAASTDNGTEPADTRKRRVRRRPTGPRIGYQIVNHAKDIEAHAGAVDTWNTIRQLVGRAKDRVVTEADVIKASGRTDASAKKAIQSNVWWLRNHDANGNRLDLTKPASARKALLRSVTLDAE
jgi:hypothetical protein